MQLPLLLEAAFAFTAFAASVAGMWRTLLKWVSSIADSGIKLLRIYKLGVTPGLFCPTLLDPIIILRQVSLS